MKTDFLQDVFNSNKFNGAIKTDKQIKKYCNKLILINGALDTYDYTIKNETDILGIVEADSITKVKNGYEYTFVLKNDIGGIIDHIGLIPQDFQSISGDAVQNTLISGSYYMILNTPIYNVIKIDVENNEFWTLTPDKTVGYSAGSDYYITLRRYHLNYNNLNIIRKDNYNMYLVQEYKYNVKDFMELYDSSSILYLAYDDINEYFYCVHINKYRQIINTVRIKLDNLDTPEIHNMMIPTSYQNIQVSGGSYYGNDIGDNYLSFYNGRLIFCYSGSNGIGYVGINPIDSTDYIDYEVAERNNTVSYSGMGKQTSHYTDFLINKKIIIKNDKVYEKKNNDYLTGTFYKGRMLDMTGTEYGVMIKYMTPYFSLCTTNKLKTAIFKDPNEDMTITYKITDEEWSI